ncbi:dipeptidyl peptidase IV N-terminal region-domain-containing protein [Polychytrium aggregatum]|uniref:dipeptidyl peptidase IV N-terminal region-domain-containing protein n=1 Tax=Polychytrium aggregatum TaxID=110093 RepID=UPI0022FEDEF9|nr:dipeptidyl peptidase IV N-terminal region-domain-containing protein [Polychytrium aggregatum]KAI9203272.1 dipeptidyl peptidase IV N-terminal region-domain-containing protein [Polychytrium aggregatum]
MLASRAARNLKQSDGNPIYYSTFQLSADAKYLLLGTNAEKGWRHSVFADYWIYDTEDKTATKLAQSSSDHHIPNEIGGGKVALALWSPSGHSIAWVRDNDLYVTVDSTVEVRLTHDGSKNIINGISDWVYEEEVLSSHSALWFSPDSTHVAYLKFNETSVPEYHLELFETKGAGSYPKEVSVKYPKAGAHNPIVTLHIATPSSSNASSLDLPVVFDPLHNFGDDDRLIVEVNWVDENSRLLVRLTNRVQDTQRLFLVSLTTDQASGLPAWIGTLVREETTPDGAWINQLRPLHVIEPSSAVGRAEPSYVELAEDENGYTHIAYYAKVSANKPTSWLTTGPWEVTQISGIDFDRGIIYYISTQEGSTQRHLYSVHLDGSTPLKLTPPASARSVPPATTLVPVMPIFNATPGDLPAKPVGVEAFFSVSFSPKCKYYLLSYEGPDVPYSKIVKVQGAHGKPHPFSSFLTRNDKLRSTLSNLQLPPVKFFTITNEDGDEMNAKLIVPHNFDPSGKTKYPIMMKCYGGPNSQSVQQTFGIDIMYSFTALGVVSLIVDGRGTGLQGRAFRTIVSKSLGQYESLDQVAAAKYMATLPWVDKHRIGIWGWSYGGYLTAKVIETNSRVFSLGVSVAPVTDWHYYDSVYTERYMKTPAMNGAGYEQSSVDSMEGFRNADYLIIHGSGDDNVHWQNTAALVWKLTGAGIRNYRMQIYPDSDHSMNAGGAQTEIFKLLEDFVVDKFQLAKSARATALPKSKVDGSSGPAAPKSKRGLHLPLAHVEALPPFPKTHTEFLQQLF